jgi:hypothetical protein
MTRKQAQEKICPILPPEYDGMDWSSVTCCHAACMAWREADKIVVDGIRESDGYCGLAGEANHL